jgi:hypothetical protein
VGVQVRCQNESSVFTVGGKIVAVTERAHQSRPNVKLLFIVFSFCGKGVIDHEFVPRGQTDSGRFYLEVMGRLREAE